MIKQFGKLLITDFSRVGGYTYSSYIPSKYSIWKHLKGIKSVLRPYFYFKTFPKGNHVWFQLGIGDHLITLER